MNQHIESGCRDNNTSTLPPSNTCRKQGCKTKLLVPMICSSCKQSYCVKHRLETDHQCTGRRAASASPSRAANTKRNLSKFWNKDVPPRPSSTPVTNTLSVSSASQTGLGIQPIDRYSVAYVWCMINSSFVSTCMTIEYTNDSAKCLKTRFEEG